MASEDFSQWLFTEAELTSTPTVLDGIPAIEERCRRAKGVNFILQAGILLKLPQLTLATASVFFHRFYMRQSMCQEKGGIHHYNIAATSLFLATKTEENCRKTKEIVIAVAKVAQKNASLIIDEQSKEYWRWRDNILLYEELMLELLTFDVVLQSPYTLLYNDLKQLQLSEHKPIRNTAWAFLNDSCLTTMCLLVPPTHLAVAAIYFAAKFCKERISDSQDSLPWWEQLDGDTNMIAKAITVMNEFYTENPLKKSDNPYGQSPMSLDDIEQTRSGFSGGTPMSPYEPQTDSQNGYPIKNGTVQSPVNGTSKDSPEGVNGNGSSDKQLKEAANDPATHEERNRPMSEIVTTTEIAHKKESPGSPKRKLDSSADEPPAKRPKTEVKTESAFPLKPAENGVKSETLKEEELEEGEEGELAE